MIDESIVKSVEEFQVGEFYRIVRVDPVFSKYAWLGNPLGLVLQFVESVNHPNNHVPEAVNGVLTTYDFKVVLGVEKYPVGKLYRITTSDLSDNLIFAKI